jgi:3-deoxy-manno-octulosonate cytidylyltransferase (CMP-KDO synthetase)
MDTKNNSVCVIIPARYKSSRFPGKPLVKINDKAMIIHVAEKASMAVGSEHVYVATDDIRISNIVSEAGFKFILTDSDLFSGTDRVAQASKQLDYDIIINLQGDEPMVDHEDILKCIDEKIKNPNKVINGYTFISDIERIESVNIPKVLFNEMGDLIYISRSIIPGVKDFTNVPKEYFKQVCIYAFSSNELIQFAGFGRKSICENFEDIEILRFFELGIEVKMVLCTGNTVAVDTPEDVFLVEKLLKGNDFR